MQYLIEQRAGDPLAFTLSDPLKDRHSPFLDIRAAWAGILHSSNRRLNLRERFALAAKERFYGSTVHHWLLGSNIHCWELDDELAYEFGPIVLRFKEPQAAMLFKLTYGACA